jgi:tetratricopeptide (TPR) repeat protein
MAICLARKGRLERARSVIAEADAASVPKIYAEQSEALGEIALSLAKSGQRQAAQAAFAQSWESTSRMAIYGIQERETRADAMYQLASLLCKAGYTEEAQRATFSIEYGSNNEAVHRLATALIQSGKYADALQIVGTDLFQQFSGIEPDGLPGMLAEWSVFFERVRPGLSLSILQEVTRVMGWVFEDWQEAYQVLADASA